MIRYVESFSILSLEGRKRRHFIQLYELRKPNYQNYVDVKLILQLCDICKTCNAQKVIVDILSERNVVV